MMRAVTGTDATGDSLVAPNDASPTCGIAEAIAALPTGGGRVRLDAGVYRLRDTIHLPASVSLVGSGPATVLDIAPLRAVPLAQDAPEGSNEVQLVEASSFRAGDAVGLTDTTNRGWWGTHTTVTRVDGTTVWVDRPVNRGLTAGDEAVAVNLFPAIQADDVSDIEIADLSVRGPGGADGPWWDFTYSAIHVVRCERTRIRDCSVTGWPSDGISIQRGYDAQVTGCRAHGCRGHGYHPGTGLGHSIWSHNIGKGNGGDGLYFCMGVHHSVCSDNVFTENGQNGIGGVANGGDHHDIISNNVCSYNGLCGIDANRGEEQLITGNLLLGNSRSDPGRWPGVRLHDMRHTLVQGNRCADDQDTPTQTFGIVESGESDVNLVSGNLCAGMSVGVEIAGPGSQAEGNLV
ncbi:right-handed parallel beta-helix repeat-containing protein [Candidatus Poribacteria bacterium]|jgi:hypothetical protein|nr:right-handed parallel beta-helix repeat-containing protein [Candidatus Poribacteria bacterium]MBT7098239.1 right-handed parallel beta-helix repeat-containing protein [Candidatus Poribacteria bacterium]MBT7806520.1 right-handed parallel beta-helix repeat-containing protein [Candidatus Poribacteria bacterium]